MQYSLNQLAQILKLEPNYLCKGFINPTRIFLTGLTIHDASLHSEKSIFSAKEQLRMLFYHPGLTHQVERLGVVGCSVWGREEA